MPILAVEPIIQSLLDIDFYKLTMGQLAWRKFFHTHVRYAFRNRTKNIKLADYIDEKEYSKISKILFGIFIRTEVS